MLPGYSEFSGKTILVTGHTGFKGSWISRFLMLAGAEVHGLALPPEKESIYSRSLDLGFASSTFLDIRNRISLEKYFREKKFDGVFHLAAQPLVLESYEKPLETFETNVMGTANLLNAILNEGTAPWVVVVTTDKVYRNLESLVGYKEADPLGGNDPYSASKTATEMVVNAWRSIAEFKKYEISICAVRAGNVIGGGDVAKNRLIPDLLRSFRLNEPATIRNPESIRPWQHVLDPLSGYLTVGKFMIRNARLEPAYNFGPAEDSKISVQEMANIACRIWGENKGFVIKHNPGKEAESRLLWLDSEAAYRDLGWKSTLNAELAIKWTIDWERVAENKDPRTAMDEQILRFFQVHQ